MALAMRHTDDAPSGQWVVHPITRRVVWYTAQHLAFADRVERLFALGAYPNRGEERTWYWLLAYLALGINPFMFYVGWPLALFFTFAGSTPPNPFLGLIDFTPMRGPWPAVVAAAIQNAWIFWIWGILLFLWGAIWHWSNPLSRWALRMAEEGAPNKWGISWRLRLIRELRAQGIRPAVPRWFSGGYWSLALLRLPDGRRRPDAPPPDAPPVPPGLGRRLRGRALREAAARVTLTWPPDVAAEIARQERREQLARSLGRLSDQWGPPVDRWFHRANLSWSTWQKALTHMARTGEAPPYYRRYVDPDQADQWF